MTKKYVTFVIQVHFQCFLIYFYYCFLIKIYIFKNQVFTKKTCPLGKMGSYPVQPCNLMQKSCQLIQSRSQYVPCWVGDGAGVWVTIEGRVTCHRQSEHTLQLHLQQKQTR